MTDEQTPPTDKPADDSANPTAAAPSPDETFGWTGDDATTSGQASTGTTAERMVSQLQSMIDSLATQAAPVVRQVGLKAAELAAADRAGPIAHKAADATAEASVKIAERSRVFAADLRRDIAAATNGNSSDEGASTATAVADPTTDIAEELREKTAQGEGDESGAIKAVLDDATDDPGNDPR